MQHMKEFRLFEIKTQYQLAESDIIQTQYMDLRQKI